MTEVIILGQEPKEEKKKPIEFVAYLMENSTSKPNTSVLLEHQPNQFETIEVIKRRGDYFHDLFLCTKSNGDYLIMIGHFNDGVV